MSQKYRVFSDEEKLVLRRASAEGMGPALISSKFQFEGRTKKQVENGVISVRKKGISLEEEADPQSIVPDGKSVLFHF
jgi:hypothetical protein